MLNIFKSAPKNYEDLNGSRFKSKYQNSPKVELLDVRAAGEFNSGTIKQGGSS